MKETILVVDSSGTRQALTNLLLSAGFSVCSVVDNTRTQSSTSAAVPSSIFVRSRSQ